MYQRLVMTQGIFDIVVNMREAARWKEESTHGLVEDGGGEKFPAQFHVAVVL